MAATKTKAKPKKRPAARSGNATVKVAAKKATPTVLVLRTCKSDMTSSYGFVWPSSGPVEAPDWEPTKKCGNGLHGWLWGEGDGSLGNWSPDAKWLVVAVDAESVIDLDGKVKFPRGEVAFCGDRFGATSYLAANGVAGRTIIGGTATAGDRGTATSGDGGTATAGDGGTATSGYRGTATAGDCGTATAGDGGTATAGDRGTATAGDGGTATAGDRGEIRVRWYDSSANRYRLAVGYIGEGGLLPDVKYRLTNDGKWEVVDASDRK